MKKVLVVLFSVALMSCGGNQSTEVLTDSTSVDSTVVVDSVLVSDTTETVEVVSGGGVQDGQEIK